MNYKLFGTARDKSAMNYQAGRFDMKLEFDIDPFSNGHRIMHLMNYPRSHNKYTKSSLPDMHLRSTFIVNSVLFLSINLYYWLKVETINWKCLLYEIKLMHYYNIFLLFHNECNFLWQIEIFVIKNYYFLFLFLISFILNSYFFLTLTYKLQFMRYNSHIT